MDLKNQQWTAEWIQAEGTLPWEYGIYHFRRAFNLSANLSAKPRRFVVHVSGDNRYQLYVNGTLASWGPARSDLTHWQYETVNLAAQLRSGKNVLAAVVWNDGLYKAVAQISNQTGFLLQAGEAEHNFVNTGPRWKSVQDKVYSPQAISSDDVLGYHAICRDRKARRQSLPVGMGPGGFRRFVVAERASHRARSP